uniref:Uncharacterized protein n=1 Tax=Cyclophora tenuis TaxID=216820 RepID=A0A7S1DAG6_CYCTE|mmetsp:Transcript_6623/g.11552  ORF Transcript_6623/g.11552 Transcript_6623/m.11552 type:complete len:179 (+) Transcript_6623:98-634(+)
MTTERPIVTADLHLASKESNENLTTGSVQTGPVAIENSVSSSMDWFKDTNGRTLNFDEVMEEEGGSSTVWDTLAMLYFPVLILWLRRSMFGTANLIRSLLVGQCLRLIINYLTASTKDNSNSSFWTETVTPWLQTFVDVKDPNAWPTPPALTVLVLLTIVAFIVHPDGLTWFVLRKLR